VKRSGCLTFSCRSRLHARDHLRVAESGLDGDEEDAELRQFLFWILDYSP